MPVAVHGETQRDRHSLGPLHAPIPVRHAASCVNFWAVLLVEYPPEPRGSPTAATGGTHPSQRQQQESPFSRTRVKHLSSTGTPEVETWIESILPIEF